MESMETLRLPPFDRAPNSIWAMRVTSRDVKIIRLVSHHRFLRSNQIISLYGGSPQQICKRRSLRWQPSFQLSAAGLRGK